LAIGIAAIVILGVASGWRTLSADPPITSLAVLPIENLSSDPAQEFAADGMTEALIGRLAQVRALRVVSRTSSMVFKGSRKTLSEIASTLGVDAVVHGSLQRSGNRIRIGVRLIDARTDAHVWARDYERGAEDVLRLQAELAEAIVAEIRVQVTPAERARLAAADAVVPAAHLEYVVGRYHLWRDSEAHLAQAIEHFGRATRIDPNYAAAFASLAHAWWKRGLWSGQLGDTEAPARAAVERALAIDHNLPEAFVVQADLVRLYDRDLVRSEGLVARALVLQPGNVDAHYTYALVLMTAGRSAEAIAQMEAAVQLDPLAPGIQSDFGRVLYRARQYDRAIVRLNRAIELEPEMGWLVYRRLAQVYAEMGQLDRALRALDQAQLPEAATERDRAQAVRARILALMGRRDDARRLLERLDSGDPDASTAAAFAALGDNDKAFATLFDSSERPGAHFGAVEPALTSLHSDPRWPEYMARVNRPRRFATTAP
jgi:TolB-like protein/Tfp pilus assembly protein PilF